MDTQKPAIRFIVQHYQSKRDIYGNTYYATLITDILTRKQCRFYSDHPSNSEAGLYGAFTNLGWQDIYPVLIEVGIREFDKRYRKWHYPGCRSKDIAAYIKKELGYV